MRRQRAIAEQVVLLRTGMTTVLAEKRALEHAFEEYVSGEVKAMALLDGQRAGQARCKRLIVEKDDAIGQLQDEIDLLIPRQREPE